jgi:hypothetical protein
MVERNGRAFSNCYHRVSSNIGGASRLPLGHLFTVAPIAGELENDGAVYESIYRRHGGHRILEDPIPLGKYNVTTIPIVSSFMRLKKYTQFATPPALHGRRPLRARKLLEPRRAVIAKMCM